MGEVYVPRLSMESADDFLSSLSDSVACGICFQIFDNPRSLPCGHTFCLTCIQRHREQSLYTMKLCCPICRHVVRQPVDELPVNYALQNVIDDAIQSSKWLCHACCEDRQLQRATARCQDCDKSLCDSCRAKHADGRHNIASLVKRKCDHHQRELELYCSSCRINICVLCYSEGHRSHECDATSKVAEKLTDSLKNVIEQLDSWRSRLVEAQALVESRKKKYERHLSNVEECASPQCVPLLSGAVEALQLDSCMRNKLKAINEIIERHNNGMSTDYNQARALMQDIKGLIDVFILQLNSHATRLQEVLNRTETLKERATGISRSPSANDVVDNEATILRLDEEVQALLQDPTIKEVFAIQESSNHLSSDIGSALALILSSGIHDELEELLKKVTVLKDLLLREQTPASPTSSPPQPPPAPAARNHDDERPRRTGPPVLPKTKPKPKTEPQQQGEQTPDRHQETVEQPQQRQVPVRLPQPVISELRQRLEARN